MNPITPRSVALFAALSLLTLAAGCSITPIDLKEPPPSLERETPNGMAEIVVLRSGSLVGAAVAFGVYINDQHVGELGITDFVSYDVRPGTVKMFAGAEARSEARFPAEANRSYFLWAYPVMGAFFARVQLEVEKKPENGRKYQKKYDNAAFDAPKAFPFELSLDKKKKETKKPKDDSP